jgi:hypothetical protein
VKPRYLPDTNNTREFAKVSGSTVEDWTHA